MFMISRKLREKKKLISFVGKAVKKKKKKRRKKKLFMCLMSG